MNSHNASPLVYHRSRRDHQLRMFFSGAQRTQNGKPLWMRVQGGGRKEIVEVLKEAIYHAREVARSRLLEWPDDLADAGDLAMLAFLEELNSWFSLLDHLAPGGEDPRAGLSPLMENRIRHGLRLFHNNRHAKTNPNHPSSDFL